MGFYMNKSKLSILLVAVLLAVATVAALAAAQETGPRNEASFDELTSVDPMPEEVIAAAGIETEIASRVDAWSERIGADEMTPDEVSGALLTIWNRGIARLHEGPTWWLERKELGARVFFLCQRLPVDDPLRSDFCAD